MRIARIAVAVAASFALTAGMASADGFVVLRIEAGEKLTYQIVAESEFDQAKAQAIEAAKPDRAKVTKISGVHETQQDAEAAMREDADKTAYFVCWRCNGEGEVAPMPDFGKPGAGGMGGGMGGGVKPGAGGGSGGMPRNERCKICGGRKRIKSDGFQIFKVKYGDSWGYVLVRRSMVGYIQEQMKAMLSLGAMGGSGDRPQISSVETLKPGQFDEAKARFEQLQTEAEGKPGFLRDLSIPGFALPQLEWPKELFAK